MPDRSLFIRLSTGSRFCRIIHLKRTQNINKKANQGYPRLAFLLIVLFLFYSAENLYTHHSSYFPSGRRTGLGKWAMFGELGNPCVSRQIAS